VVGRTQAEIDVYKLTSSTGVLAAGFHRGRASFRRPDGYLVHRYVTPVSTSLRS